MDEIESAQPGLGRRQLIKRSAVVGGALVWATPVVQSLAGPAYAAGSVACVTRVIVTLGPGLCIDIGSTTASPACCECLRNGVPANCVVQCQDATGFTPSPPTIVTCPS